MPLIVTICSKDICKRRIGPLQGARTLSLATQSGTAK